MTPWERLAYAIARGVARAWFEEARKAESATEEQANEEDRRRADAFTNAVGRVRHLLEPDGGGATRWDGPPQSGGGGGGGRLG